MFFLTYFKLNRGNNKKDKKGGAHRGAKKSLRCSLVVIAAAVTALVCIGVVLKMNEVPRTAHSKSLGDYSLSAADDREREEFFAFAGYRAEKQNKRQIKISAASESFDRYNEVLNRAGLDLKKYSGKLADEYIYKLYKENEKSSELYAVMTVYKGRVIAVYLTDFSASPDEPPVMMPFTKAG